MYSQYISNNEISIEELEHFATDDENIHSPTHLLSISVNGTYAINDKLSIGFSLPYIERGNLIEAAHGLEDNESRHDDGDYGQHHEDEENSDHRHEDSIEYFSSNFSKYWDFILELNGDWRDKVRVENEIENHTGGNIVYLNPGFRFGFGNDWFADFSFGFPIIENLNGIQSEPDFRFLGGINMAF